MAQPQKKSVKKSKATIFLKQIAKEFKINDLDKLTKAYEWAMVCAYSFYDHLELSKKDDVGTAVTLLENVEDILTERLNHLRLGDDASRANELVDELLALLRKHYKTRKNSPPKARNAENVVSCLADYWVHDLGRKFSFYRAKKNKSHENTDAARFIKRITRELGISRGVDLAAVRYANKIKEK